MWNTTKTIPTVGRKVWFWPHLLATDNDNVVCIDSTQPFDATVVFVSESRKTVNLSVTDHEGNIHDAWDVPLYDPLPPDEIQGYLENLVDMEADDNRWGIATWMPYQAAQHAKQVEQESKLQDIDPVDLTLTDGKDV